MDFSFIHAADIHLDSPLKGLSRYEGAPVDKLRSATRDAFRNLVNLAIEERVNFIIIAGDLYDGDWKDYNTGLFFASEMARLNKHEIPVFMINGNHDAASIITKEIKLPENVNIFNVKKCETKLLEDLNVALHGQGFQTRAVVDNLAKAYPDKLAGYFNIGILHTSAGGREGHENYAPCTLDDMKGKAYDYWALGHIHKREILSDERPVIIFPGNIQSRHSKETGEKGCTLIRVESGEINHIQHVPLDVLRWDVIELDASGIEAYEEFLSLVEELLERSYLNADHRMLAVRFIVVGQTSIDMELRKNREGVLNDIRSIAFSVGQGDIWIEKIKIKTSHKKISTAIQNDGSPISTILNWVDDTADLSELLDEIKGEFSTLSNSLPIELKRGENQVIPSTEEMLAEKLDEVKHMIQLQLELEEVNR